MVKIACSCSKNIIERFGEKRPDDWNFVYINYPCSDEELVEQCKDADILFCGPVDPIRRNVIEKLDKCKLIHSLGVGYDKIDLDAAREKGIYVCNNRAVNALPVAEHAIGLMISCLRRMCDADKKIKSGKFIENFREYQIKGQCELNSRTIGLVGMGAIGKASAKILKAFGSKVLYYDQIRVDPDFEKEYDLKFASYDEILKTCDIISYHVPVSDSTRNMVRKETIDKMKQDAIIINVARGEIVNNEDLADALNNGRILAGLDVVAPEPPPEDFPLFHLNETGNSRIVITPHIAGTTDDAFGRMVKWSYDNMKRVMNGEAPINVVNGYDPFEKYRRNYA